jgi:hypothetical protein
LTFIAASSSTLSDVEPGVLGFLIVAGIAVALVFLLRSMNKQFRKLPPPEDGPEAGARPKRGLAARRAGADSGAGFAADAGAAAKHD